MDKNIIYTGAEAKILQYNSATVPNQVRKRYGIKVNNNKTNNDDLIKINDLLSTIFEKNVNDNVLMINIMKDTERYKNTIDEFKKLSITNFVHLIATYWKDRNNMVNDLNKVINFLKQFTNNITNNITNNVTIDYFSELNDSNILIQDGPLACYISHVRAMIHGYENFEDYTIVVEDDIDITNTKLIEEYLPQIPDDWDIIFFNSCPKNVSYGDTKMYKFIESFHSLHFYIIKNTSFPKIFSKLYPITDQVDVLIANGFRDLNYYNITSTVMQKNISTNTQNNLKIIYNSPSYNFVRRDIDTIKYQLNVYLNNSLPNNVYNDKIKLDILFDVIYRHIGRGDKTIINKYNCIDIINKNIRLSILNDAIVHFLYSTEKGTDVTKQSINIVGKIMELVNLFDLHGKELYVTNKYTPSLVAYSYGYSYGTLYVLYKCDNHIIKKYVGNIEENNVAFKKDVHYLNILDDNNFIYSDPTECILIYELNGNIIMDDWMLPNDWKNQIINIFNSFEKKNLVPIEINIKNIFVNKYNINLLDLEFVESTDTKLLNKMSNFVINFVTILDNKFATNKLNILENRYLLHKIFVDNIFIHKYDIVDNLLYLENS